MDIIDFSIFFFTGTTCFQFLHSIYYILAFVKCAKVVMPYYLDLLFVIELVNGRFGTLEIAL